MTCSPHVPSILALTQLWGLTLLLPPSAQSTHIFHSAGAQERMNVCLKNDDKALARLSVGERGDIPLAQCPHGISIYKATHVKLGPRTWALWAHRLEFKF